MIKDNEGLAQTLEAMGMMHRALVSLRKDILPVNPRNFAVYASGFVNEVRKLEEQINEYTGRAVAEEYDSDVWLRIVGPPQEMPEVPMSLVTALLEAFRKAAQAVVGFASVRQSATHPSGALERASDFRITAFRLVGPCVGMRIPDDLDGCDPEDQSLVRQALGRLLQVADWVGSDAPTEALDRICPDPHERRVLLDALEPLVPRLTGTSSVSK